MNLVRGRGCAPLSFTPPDFIDNNFNIKKVMKKISNLEELLLDNLKRVYASEQAQHTALADIQKRANSGTLRSTFLSYRKMKEQNISRLKQCFDEFNMPHRGQKCETVESLLQNCQANVSHAAEEHVADASLIGTFQQINHFNIANYGTMASYAKTLQKHKAADLLHQVLEDEKNADSELSNIAEETINPAAVLA